MSPAREDRWYRIDALLREALEQAPGDRAEFLERSCPDDAIRTAVEDLLRAESESRSFLSRPVDALADVPWDEIVARAMSTRVGADPGRNSSDRAGDRVGPYRLVRRLGRGGMATVYLAERADGLWEQRVALKLIRRGLDTEDVIRRFLSERQILSTLTHPNIARLLDGGTTPEGLPFLVMEYVQGTPITEYCDRHRLGVDERLRLFCEVGRAVQHAHRMLVVHRDLKPSNILVTAEGRPKLLDFGIAKILDPDGDQDRTRTGRRPLTPGYASPEQARGDAITTVSDVYQLGLLLSELLAGCRPLPPHRPPVPTAPPDASHAWAPARPSSLVTAEAAADRGTGRDRLARRLRGDLDMIVLRAVREEPRDRYASAEALVQDVERHVQGMPVAARPPTMAYRARKLLRRRPWILPTLLAVLLSVVGYVVTLARHSAELERERNTARAEAERAREVRDLLVDVFRSADPYAGADASDPDVTVREAMAPGVSRIRSDLDGRPALQATLLGTIGEVYANLDLPDRALELHEETLALQRRVHGPRSAPAARTLRKLGLLQVRAGRLDSARSLLTRALEMTRGAGGRSDTAVAGVLADLGDLEGAAGRYETAEEHLTGSIRLLRDRDPLPAAQLARAQTLLSGVYLMNDRPGRARTAAEAAVRLSRRAHGADDPRTAIAMTELADLLDWEGSSDAARAAYREAIPILERELGPAHERTLAARNNLAVTLRHLGELEEAEEVHRTILAVVREKEGAQSPRGADALQNLAVVLKERGKLAEAEQALRSAHRTYDSVLPAGHFRRAYPRLTLASMRLDRGDFRGAERAAREAVEILESALPDSSYVTATARCRVGRALAGQGRRAEARALLESSVEMLARAAQPTTRYRRECRGALADLYRELDLPGPEREQRARIREAGGSGALGGARQGGARHRIRSA